jgi:DDE family transposase
MMKWKRHRAADQSQGTDPIITGVLFELVYLARLYTSPEPGRLEGELAFARWGGRSGGPSVDRYGRGDGQKLRRYWTNACRHCALKQRCTTGVQRRIARWEHEDVLEAVQKRLDKNPQAMRQRRETVEHLFGTLKMRMGRRTF